MRAGRGRRVLAATVVAITFASLGTRAAPVSAQAVSTLWGIDSCDPAQSVVPETQSILGAPQFMARYLGTTNACATAGLTAPEVSYLSSQDIYIMLIADPGGFGSSPSGTSEAQTAIQEAQSLGAPPGTAIFRDVEATAPITTQYIEDWYQAFESSTSGYVPGFYENPNGGSDQPFNSQYCSAVQNHSAIGSVPLWSSSPEKSSYTPNASQSPAWSGSGFPGTPSCDNNTVAWQYLEQGINSGSWPSNSPNVDVDEFEASYQNLLWTPPVVTNAASSITATSATVNGTVNPNGTQCWMQYYWGTTPSFGNYLAGSPNNGDLSVGSGQSAVSEPRTLSGLQPNTTYYFEIEANQVNGSNVATGATLSFTTARVPSTAVTNAASSITATSATLNGTVNPNGTQCWMQYYWGTTLSFGNYFAGSPNNGDLSVGSGQSAVSEPRTLSGLQPNTTYYFEIEANQVNGSNVATGATLSFTTNNDARTVVRGVGGVSWELEGLDSASPVFSGAWEDQGGLAVESPVVVSVPDASGVGTPLYIVTGIDHSVWVSWESGPWGRLSSPSFDCTDAAAATVVASTPGSTSAYTLVVACRGTNGALWWVSGPATAGTLPSDFTGWTSLGGIIASGINGGPAVAAVEPPAGTSISFSKELTFFVNGIDGQVWETTAAAGSAGWTGTGWRCKGHLAAAAFVASGTLTSAFACQGTDSAVWAATTMGAGWDLQRLGGIVIDGPGIAMSPTSWTVVADGTDQALWQTTSTSTAGSFSFGPWTRTGGVLTNGASATALLTAANNP
jgi:hypothetical protein